MSHSHGHGAPSRGLVTATVLFYLVAALAMVMANKWVLNQTTVPLFFLDCQLFIAVFLFLGAHMLGLLQLPLSLDPQVCKGLIPMVGLNVIGLSFSNYTLKYVDASFYQVARGMVLPFTVFTSFIALHARPSLQIILACSVVTFGFFVGVFLDGTHVSMLGIFFGIASSMITAVHSVVIKKSLDVVKGSALHLSWYTNLLSSLALIPIVILTGEVPGIMELLFGGAVGTAKGISPLATFAWGSAITGIFGFLMSIASLLSIKITSPITHMVSSAVRGVAASILGWAIFADIISVSVIIPLSSFFFKLLMWYFVSGRATSIATILSGSIYYTWVKHLESQGPKYERVNMEKVEEGRKGEA